MPRAHATGILLVQVSSPLDRPIAAPLSAAGTVPRGAASAAQHAAPWNRWLPGWIAPYNVLFLSSVPLPGWSLGWVLRRSGRSWAAALLGGALYAFCPFRWHQVPHLQALLMAAIPPALWTFDRLL